ncbi:MAG: hypothetical protein WBF99_04155 [Xanthobacteraceae bacterium]
MAVVKRGVVTLIARLRFRLRHSELQPRPVRRIGLIYPLSDIDGARDNAVKPEAASLRRLGANLKERSRRSALFFRDALFQDFDDVGLRDLRDWNGANLRINEVTENLISLALELLVFPIVTVDV